MLKSSLLIVASIGITCAYAGTTNEYSKENGVASIKPMGQLMEFFINSSVDMHACEISGVATMIDANRAAYISDDSEEKCTVLLSLDRDLLKVTTRSCESYCGLSAQGSMDGLYKASEASQPSEQALLDAVAEGFAQAAAEANAKGPIMVDPNTRLDQTIAGPGAKLTYFYSFPGYSSQAIKQNWDIANAQATVTNGVCGSQGMSSSLQNGGVYVFSYSGNDGVMIAQFEIDKSDCNEL